MSDNDTTEESQEGVDPSVVQACKRIAETLYGDCKLTAYRLTGFGRESWALYYQTWSVDEALVFASTRGEAWTKGLKALRARAEAERSKLKARLSELDGALGVG